jgi:hypothetical protein
VPDPETDSAEPSRWSEADRTALDGLSALEGPALPWSDWAMRPTAIRQIVDIVAAGVRSRMFELGAGVSTVLFARAARETGATIVAVEHDGEWAGTVADLLKAEGLDDVAAVVHAPLAPLPDSVPLRDIAAPERPHEWYDLELTRGACRDQPDLLVVDGPPAGDRPTVLVRAPAVPALQDLLAPGFAVVLDDITRSAERRTAELWARELGDDLLVSDEADLGMLRPH